MNELHPQMAKLIQPFLSSGDIVLMCHEWSERLYLCGDPSYLSVGVITQSRFIAAERRPSSGVGTANYLPLVDIVSVRESAQDWDKGSLLYHVAAHTEGNETVSCSFVSQPQSQKFYQVLKEAIEQARIAASRIPSEPLLSPEERLRRLAQLRNDGLISEEEFQQQRAVILGEL